MELEQAGMSDQLARYKRAWEVRHLRSQLEHLEQRTRLQDEQIRDGEMRCEGRAEEVKRLEAQRDKSREAEREREKERQNIRESSRKDREREREAESQRDHQRFQETQNLQRKCSLLDHDREVRERQRGEMDAGRIELRDLEKRLLATREQLREALTKERMDGENERNSSNRKMRDLEEGLRKERLDAERKFKEDQVLLENEHRRQIEETRGQIQGLEADIERLRLTLKEEEEARRKEEFERRREIQVILAASVEKLTNLKAAKVYWEKWEEYTKDIEERRKLKEIKDMINELGDDNMDEAMMYY